MDQQAYYQQQLERFLGGEFGELSALYGNMVVAGEVSELNAIQAAFGLYEDWAWLHVFSETSVTLEWLIPEILGYELTNELAQAQQLALLQREHPDWRDPAVSARLWAETKRELSRLGLPISFFAYGHGLDGKPNVGF